MKFCMGTGMLAASLVAIFLTGCATTVNPESSSRGESLLDVAPDGKDSPTADTLYRMARVLATKNEPEKAERLLVQLIDTFPKFAPGYVALADLQLQQGRLDEATGVLARGITVHPADGILLNNLGVCRILEGDYEAALACFEDADRANPYHRRYQANIALAQGLLGRTEAASAGYQGILPKSDIEHNLKVIGEMSAFDIR